MSDIATHNDRIAMCLVPIGHGRITNIAGNALSMK
jgi:hypothetical protein